MSVTVEGRINVGMSVDTSTLHEGSSCLSLTFKTQSFQLNGHSQKLDSLFYVATVSLSSICEMTIIYFFSLVLKRNHDCDLKNELFFFKPMDEKDLAGKKQLFCVATEKPNWSPI